jgi:mycothiol system anti-sigma-R factor
MTDHDSPDPAKCSEALHELYRFIDGELTEERLERVKEHLEGCPPCFEAFDFEAEVKAYIAGKVRESCPDELRARIAQAIGREPLA